MNEFAGVNIRLSREEFERLRDTAQRDLRHPRDQARYLLRLALGLTTNPPIREMHGDVARAEREVTHANTN
jgi:hypothetical protein